MLTTFETRTLGVRVLFKLVATWLVVLVGMVGTPQTTMAQGVPLAVCTGSHSVQFDPGITNVAATLSITSNDQWTCPLSLLNPGTSSASTINTYTDFISCDALMHDFQATWPITWADGSVSHYQYSGTVNAVNGVLTIVFTGTFLDGHFAGDKAVDTIVIANPQGTIEDACASPSGLTSLNGNSTLTILPSAP